MTPIPVFLFSLILFALAVIVIAVAASRGLSNIDDILTIVEPGDPEFDAPHSTIQPKA